MLGPPGSPVDRREAVWAGSPSSALTKLTNIPSFQAYRCLATRKAVGKPVNIYEAKTRLSELVDRAAAGEEIVIAKAGRPAARLVPFRVAHARRTPGRWAGRMTIAADFDAPLPPELVADFEGE
jgi:prevent-host-death family protein